MVSVHVCRSCRRHLRAPTETCPFCGARPGLDPTRLLHTSLMLITMASAAATGCVAEKDAAESGSAGTDGTSEAGTSEAGTSEAGTTGPADTSTEDGITTDQTASYGDYSSVSAYGASFTDDSPDSYYTTEDTSYTDSLSDTGTTDTGTTDTGTTDTGTTDTGTTDTGTTDTGTTDTGTTSG